ncbi:MAG: FkbM family methyltransferase [Raineya sp.]|nr:FkbM family methyltransferase [Raineya sp.]
MNKIKRYLNLLKNTKNWYKYFAVKQNPDKLFLLKGKNDVSFWLVEEILPIFKEIYMENVYQIEFLQEKINSRSPVILDIGANAGYAATFLFSYFPKARIISFEPLPINFELLSKNQKQNSSLDWQIIPKAVGKARGETTLFYSKAKGFTPIASIQATFESQNTDTLVVEMLALTDILQEYNLQVVDLLKVDCEGAEYDIFYHTPSETWAKIRCIAMETHKGKEKYENQESMTSFLQEKGFQVKTKQEMLWAWKET